MAPTASALEQDVFNFFESLSDVFQAALPETPNAKTVGFALGRHASEGSGLNAMGAVILSGLGPIRRLTIPVKANETAAGCMDDDIKGRRFFLGLARPWAKA